MKSFAPDRNTVTIVINNEDSNFKTKSPELLANINEGDEIDFTVEGTQDQGFTVATITLTKASGKTTAPKPSGAPVAAPGSGVPPPAAASGAPAPAPASGAPSPGAPASSPGK